MELEARDSLIPDAGKGLFPKGDKVFEQGETICRMHDVSWTLSASLSLTGEALDKHIENNAHLGYSNYKCSHLTSHARLPYDAFLQVQAKRNGKKGIWFGHPKSFPQLWYEMNHSLEPTARGMLDKEGVYWV